MSPSIIKESLASSEIEDVHTTLINVFQNSLLPESERRLADKEVLRYREAILFGFNKLAERSVIGTGLMLGIQNVLMQTEGDGFRTDQNAIFNPKTTEIVFVPPKAEDINDLVKNWEEYVNVESKDIKNDPFNDGNGRTGRILMVLQLIKHELLTAPILYISGYINKNRTQYYQLPRGVTNEDEWKEYILFMVKGFKEQAYITKKHLLDTKELFEETRKKIKKNCRSFIPTNLSRQFLLLLLLLQPRFRTKSAFIILLQVIISKSYRQPI